MSDGNAFVAPRPGLELGPRVAAALQVVLVLVLSLVGASTAVALFSAPKPVVFVLLGGGTALAALLLSGNPRLCCLYGLVLAAPLDMAKRFMKIPHIGGSSALRIDFVDIFILALIVFQVRDMMKGYRAPRTLRIPWLCSSWVALTLLGAGWVIAGPWRTVPALEVVRMLKCLVLFLVVVNELVRVKRMGHMFVALMCSVALQGSVGLIQYAFGTNLGLQVLGEETEEQMKLASDATLATHERVNRVGALMGHSNHLAAFLALLLPVGTALLFTQVDLRIRALTAVALLLGTAALLATLSRTGWVAFGAALVGVLAIGSLHPRSGGRHALRRLGVMAGMAVVLLAFSGPVLKRLFHSDPWAVRVRMEYLEVAWRMIKDRPVLGHGLNSYVFRMGPYSELGRRESVVHNNYALVWVEQGTVGLVLFLALPVHVLAIGIRNLRRLRHDTLFALNVGTLCGLTAMTLDWLSSFSLRTEPMGRMYWMQAGLLCAIAAWHRLHSATATAAGAGGTAPGAPLDILGLEKSRSKEYRHGLLTP